MFNHSLLPILTKNEIKNIYYTHYRNDNKNIINSKENGIFDSELISNNKYKNFIAKFNKKKTTDLNKSEFLIEKNSSSESHGYVYGVEDGFGESFSVYDKNGKLDKDIHINSVSEFGLMTHSMPSCRLVVL